MGEGEHRRRRIRGTRGAYVSVGDSAVGDSTVGDSAAGASAAGGSAAGDPAAGAPANGTAPVPAGRGPAEPIRAEAIPPEVAEPESAVASVAAPTPPPAKPTPATGRSGFRAMFGARPGAGPVPAPPAMASAPPVPADRARPPARPGVAASALDKEPIDAHAVTPGSEDHERGLRGLIGGGASQVSVTAAMRARDAARPTAEDIAAAEASLTIVHRGWVPRDP